MCLLSIHLCKGNTNRKFVFIHCFIISHILGGVAVPGSTTEWKKLLCQVTSALKKTLKCINISLPYNFVFTSKSWQLYNFELRNSGFQNDQNDFFHVNKLHSSNLTNSKSWILQLCMSKCTLHTFYKRKLKDLWFIYPFVTFAPFSKHLISRNAN